MSGVQAYYTRWEYTSEQVRVLVLKEPTLYWWGPAVPRSFDDQDKCVNGGMGWTGAQLSSLHSVRDRFPEELIKLKRL